MTDSSAPQDRLQWKWVGITFVFYLIFYLLPLAIFVQFLPDSIILPGIWFFAGIVIVAGVAGYMSEGITIYEPAIAGAGLTVLLLAYVALVVFPAAFRGAFVRTLVFIFIPSISVFVLSVSGAWLGEQAQKHWKDNPHRAS